MQTRQPYRVEGAHDTRAVTAWIPAATPSLPRYVRRKRTDPINRRR